MAFELASRAVKAVGGPVLSERRDRASQRGRAESAGAADRLKWLGEPATERVYRWPAEESVTGTRFRPAEVFRVRRRERERDVRDETCRPRAISAIRCGSSSSCFSASRAVSDESPGYSSAPTSVRVCACVRSRVRRAVPRNADRSPFPLPLPPKWDALAARPGSGGPDRGDYPSARCPSRL